MNEITYCIPSKNNLRYLKSSIASIKQNSSIPYDIIVYIDMDNDGTEDWLKDNDISYIKNDIDTPRGIAYGYNRCIEKSVTDIVCMFHADMYMAKGFDINVLKHLKPGIVVSGTRIEPPLHPAGKEKIVMNFGMYPEDFQRDQFDKFVEESVNEYKDVITHGIFAPWAIYRDAIISIGMHDESLHSYYEDSDIFNRMILNGMQCVQAWDAFVYHLTCRGGQFQDGVERITNDEQFHTMKHNSFKNYLRKWGSWIKNDEYQHPIIAPKYNIAFVVSNCNLVLLEHLEPFCDRIYVDEVFAVGRARDYIEMEQNNTTFDLTKRVLNKYHNDPNSENDIIVEFDANRITNASFNIIQQLPEILQETSETGVFELDIFKITIHQLQTYQHNLIHL
jgi:glycosyltransferase involved in cell wall biosynthesis